MLVSVIIPTLNEERYIANTLQFLSAVPQVEIIVVDGGSIDKTVQAARHFTEYVFLTHAGRAHQMNFGAQHATGDVLLFLHADTMLLPGAIEMVRYHMRRVNVVGGAFDLHLDSERALVRAIARLGTLRSRLTRVPYGDQGLFIRSRIFQHIGGFKLMPIMEDLEFAKRMRRMGRVMFISEGLVSSARRWEHNGAFKTTGTHLLLLALYHLGFSTKRLARLHDRLLHRGIPPATAEAVPPQKPAPKAN